MTLRVVLLVLLVSACGYAACVNELVDAIVMLPIPPSRLTREILHTRLADNPHQITIFTIDHGTERVGSFEIAPSGFAYYAYLDKELSGMLSAFALGTWQVLGMSGKEDVHLVIPENTTVCDSNRTLEENDIMGAIGLFVLTAINPSLTFGCYKKAGSSVCDVIYPKDSARFSTGPFFACLNLLTAAITLILCFNWNQILSWAGPDMFRRGAENVRGFGFMCASIFVPGLIWLPGNMKNLFELIWCFIFAVSLLIVIIMNFTPSILSKDKDRFAFPMFLYPAIFGYVASLCLTFWMAHVKPVSVLLLFAINISVVAVCFAVARFWATPANRFAHGLIAFNNFLARTVFPKDRLARFSVMSKKARDTFIAAHQRDLSDPHDTRTEKQAFKDTLLTLARILPPEDATGVLETFVIDSAESPKVDSLFRTDEEGHVAFRSKNFEEDANDAWDDMNYSQVIDPGIIIHFVAVITLSLAISAAASNQSFAYVTGGFNIPVVAVFAASMAVACTNWAQRDAAAAYEAVQTE